MATRIQIRRGTSSEWSNENPTLSIGEIGFVTDEYNVKIGDGTSTWSELEYLVTGSSASGSVDLPDGLISGSSQIEYTLVSNIPTGIVSGSSQLTSSLDTRYVNDSDYIIDSASFRNDIDGIVAGGSGADWDVNLTNIPGGLVSGSSQLTSSYDTRYTLSGSVISGTDITSLNTFTSSIQNEVDGISAETSSYLTELPVGLLSGSKTDITSLNTFTSSIQNEVDTLSSETSSYLTELPDDLISGSDQVTSSLDGRYVDLTTNQTNIAGEKTFTGAASSFSGRLGVGNFPFGPTAVGDAPLQSDTVGTRAIRIISGSGAEGSGAQVKASIFTNDSGDTLTIKGFDDSIMVTDFTSIAAVSGSEPAESTIANSIEHTNGHLWINDQGVQIYPGVSTPVAETHFQIFQNRNGAERMGFYSAFYSGSGDYDRIYAITPEGSFEFEHGFHVTGSVTASAFTIDGSTSDDILLGDGTTTSLSGSRTDITSLNSFTSSIDTTIDTYITDNLVKTSKTTLTSTSGEIDWTGQEGNLYEITLTEDTLINNPSSPVDGASYTFRIKQDGTGLWVLTFGSNWNFPNGTTPSITLDPNAKDYLTVIVDGTELDAVEVQNFL